MEIEKLGSGKGYILMLLEELSFDEEDFETLLIGNPNKAMNRVLYCAEFVNHWNVEYRKRMYFFL